LLFTLGVTVFKIRARWLAWVGVSSYSLYLFHPIVFNALRQVIFRFDLAFLQGLHIAFYILIAMVLSVLFAWLIYALVEAPSIRLGRKFTRS
jgi:peptidoglycan/LPS O-acetylase OafA/YrhL